MKVKSFVQTPRALGLGLLLMLVAGFAWLGTDAQAVGGDFMMVDFVAAAPFTYDHSTGGGAYDDRTVGDTHDVTEQLEGGQFSCGDIVTYLMAFEVDPTPVDPLQTAQFDFSFLADSTGQSGAALGDIVNVQINYGPVQGGDGPGGTDSFIMDDGGSTATLISETLTGPLFVAGSELLGTVEIDDIEAGEKIVLRIDVRLFCQPGSSPTGNLQAKLEEGRVVAPVMDIINTGAQTIPFLKVGQLTGVNAPRVMLTKTVTTADGTCGVDDVDVLHVFAGDTVKYCYVVENTGTATLFDVELVDDNGTPGNTLDDFVVALTGLADLDGQGDLGDLAAGGVATGEALVVIGDMDVTNIATVTGNNGRTGGNFEEFTDSDDATVLVEIPPNGELMITKTVTTADGTCPGVDSLMVFAGESVKYCYAVTNTGDGAVLDVMVIDDNATADPGDDFTVTLSGLTDEDGDGFADDLAPGATATGEVVILIGSAGTFTNVATATGTDEHSGEDRTDDDDATVTAEPPPNGMLVIDKTVTTAGGTCPGVDSLMIFAGDTVKYCYVVSNPGDGAVLDVTVIDDNGTADPGDDFTVTLIGLTDEDGDGMADDLGPGGVATAEVLKTFPDVGTVTNVATVTGTDEYSGEDRSDDDDATVTSETPPRGELAISKTVTTAGGTCPGVEVLNITAGDTVKYCYAVTNIGDGAVLDVMVIDDNATADPGDDFSVPLAGLTDEDGDGFADDLAPGATATGEVLKSFDIAGTFINVATATGTDEHSGDDTTDTDDATVTVETGEVPCVDNPLGTAGDFTIFVFGDLTASNTDSTGRVAAGGNANLTNFGVGLALTNSNGTRDDLVVGGNLTYTNGNVYNGNVVHGGTASLMSVTLFNGTVRQDTPIDFGAEQAFQKSLSAFLGSQPATASTVVEPWGGIFLTGTDPVLNIFQLSGSALASATYFQISAPAGATVLINVSGTMDQMQNFGFSLVGGVTRNFVLFNFFEATSLTLQGIGVEGTILAPCAHVNFNNGDVNGSIIADSLSGYGESHHVPFDGCLPLP